MLTFDITPSFFIIRSAASMVAATVSSEIKIRVYPDWFKSATLSWTIPVEWGNATFEVFRSSSPQTGFEKLSTGPIDSNHWVDYNTYQDSTHRRDYYIVEVTSDAGKFRSPPASLSTGRVPYVKVVANEISRRENLMLRKYLGVPAMLFKRRTYGARCNSCWDPATEKVVRSSCDDCCGTSFKGGYHKGILSYFQFEPSSKDVQHTHFGKLESNQSSCWTTSLPIIDPEDILVRLEDYRLFYVAQVRQTEMQSATLRQMAAVSELNHHAPEFALIRKYKLDILANGLSGRDAVYGVDTSGSSVEA